MTSRSCLAGDGGEVQEVPQLLMSCGTTGYNRLVNACTAPGVAAGSADPLLYVTCYVECDYTAQWDVDGEGSECVPGRQLLAECPCGGGRAGNPGPADYPNDPQAVVYRARFWTAPRPLIDFSAPFDASVDTSLTPIYRRRAGIRWPTSPPTCRRTTALPTSPIRHRQRRRAVRRAELGFRLQRNERCGFRLGGTRLRLHRGVGPGQHDRLSRHAATLSATGGCPHKYDGSALGAAAPSQSLAAKSRAGVLANVMLPFRPQSERRLGAGARSDVPGWTGIGKTGAADQTGAVHLPDVDFPGVVLPQDVGFAVTVEIPGRDHVAPPMTVVPLSSHMAT